MGGGGGIFLYTLEGWWWIMFTCAKGVVIFFELLSKVF